MYFTRYVTRAKIRDVGTLLRDSQFIVFLRLGALRPKLSATAEQALELRMEMLESPVVDCDRTEAQWGDIRKAFEHLGLTVDGLDEERPFFVAFDSERLRDPGVSRVPCRIAYVELGVDGGGAALDVDEACLAAFGEIYGWTRSAERQAAQNADREKLMGILASLLAEASSTAERDGAIESSGDQHFPLSSPDLILQVSVTQDQGKAALLYHLLAPTGKVALHLETFRGPVLDGSPDAFAAALFAKIESLPESLNDEDGTPRLKSAEKEFADLGRWLYRKLFPPEMRAAYRKFRGGVETIQITSDEPWIPWEFVKPYDDEVTPAIDDDFLCAQFQLTRWLAGDKIPIPAFFVGRMAVVGAENAPGSRPLPNAAKEHEMLSALAGRHTGIEPVELPEATYEDLENLLRRGGLGILHFIGHGDARAERPDDAKIVLKDRPFRSYNLSGDLQTAIKNDRPLVFLNACRVARQGWSLSGLGGWAEAWVRTCGCGAFVGPQWVVKDSLAFEFSRVFYESLEEGKTFGQAVSAAREAVRRKDPGRPTWLAYVAYGNPGARLVWSKEKEAPEASSEPNASDLPGSKPSSPPSKSIFSKEATKLDALILLVLAVAVLAWKLWPVATPKLSGPSPSSSVKTAPVNPEQRSKRNQQEAPPEKRSSAQEPPSRKAPSEAPRVWPAHPSEKPLTETKPIPDSPEPKKSVGKPNEPDSNVAELAKVEVIDVSGKKWVFWN